MLAQQHAEPGQRRRAQHLERVPQGHLVRREHRLAQLALEPLDGGKRAPVAAGEHHGIGVRPIEAAREVIGRLRIEQADLEVAHEAERALRQHLAPVRFDEGRGRPVDRLNPNFSLAQGYYGLILVYCGRWEEGSQAAGRALRLSPRNLCSAIHNGIASYAQFVGRNYEEAMRFAREGTMLRGDFVGAHRVLTAAAAMAGQGEVAKAAFQELRRAQPNISLAWIAREMPIKEDAEREHYLEGFRSAGLA